MLIKRVIKFYGMIIVVDKIEAVEVKRVNDSKHYIVISTTENEYDSDEFILKNASENELLGILTDLIFSDEVDNVCDIERYVNSLICGNPLTKVERTDISGIFLTGNS